MASYNQRRYTAGFLPVARWIMMLLLLLMSSVTCVVSSFFPGKKRLEDGVRSMMSLLEESNAHRMLQTIDTETCNGMLDEYSLIRDGDGDLCTCSTTTGGNIELACEPVNRDDSRGCVFGSNMVFIDLFDTVVEVTPEGMIVTDTVCIFVQRLSFSGISTEIGTVCIDFTNFYNSCEVAVDGVACTSCQPVECTLQGRGGGLQQYVLPSLDCRNLPTEMAGMWDFCDEESIAPDFSNPLVAIDPHIYDYQTRCNANRAKPVPTSSPTTGTPSPVTPVSANDCSLCENGEPPPFPDLVLQGETCSEINDNVAGESEERCTAGQATFGVYCGCQNPIASQGACRVCGDGTLLPDPTLVVFPGSVGGDCVNLEFTANVESEGISCEQAQTIDVAPVCCGTVAGPETMGPTTPPTTLSSTLSTTLSPATVPPTSIPTASPTQELPSVLPVLTTATTIPTTSDSMVSMLPTTTGTTTTPTMLPTITTTSNNSDAAIMSDLTIPCYYWQVNICCLLIWLLS